MCKVRVAQCVCIALTGSKSQTPPVAPQSGASLATPGPPSSESLQTWYSYTKYGRKYFDQQHQHVGVADLVCGAVFLRLISHRT